MSRSTRCIVLLLSVTLLAAGCSKKPKDALVNLQEAVEKGDADAFVACFDATEEQQKALRSMGKFLSGMRKFEDAMRKEYGDDAMKNFKSPEGPGGKDWLDKITIKEEGDKATATHPDEKKPLTLVKKDGDWKIDFASMVDGEQAKDLDKALKMFDAIAKVCEGQMQNIGKEGYSAERINKEFALAMMGAMMGAAGP